jgi:predicted methyltransferase
VLRNPADDRKRNVFDAAIRGHTDQFIYKFRKPAK